MEEDDDENDLTLAKARLFANDVVHDKWRDVTGLPPLPQLQVEAVREVERRVSASINELASSDTIRQITEDAFRTWWMERGKRS